MKAVVLAGGEGTRLKPLTYKRPKPLMPVAGRPCIDYVLRSLAASGFHEIIVTTAYLSDALIKSIGDGLDYNASILYSFEENPAGTAGAVRRVANFIDETFVVAMGDILCDVDFKALFEFHKRTGGVVTIALTDVDDPTQYGIVGLDAKGRIQKFKEKPRKEEAFSSLVNAGIYVLEPEVLEFIPPDQKFDFARTSSRSSCRRACRCTGPASMEYGWTSGNRTISGRRAWRSSGGKGNRSVAPA